ncbi:hypothetical protein EUGRSUZ_J01775 [Eucalyptus grandis]|uniref:Uncharacterized protein n=2 Tax=Eucalyptus grandis TaxID=71139 RepID=A0A059AF44_EUCGR|nr:hypothetical protein EUGRSUZ_J01775 [Eucalyptus grandis]
MFSRKLFSAKRTDPKSVYFVRDYRAGSHVGLLIASEIISVPAVKALLYLGAVVNGLVKNMTVPSWNDLLDIYNLTTVKEAPGVVLAGSYFSVAGALVRLLKPRRMSMFGTLLIIWGLLKPGRMSMFGTLLIIWGLVKEGILGKPVNVDPAKAVHVYPTMLLALICALSSIKYDVKKAMRPVPV